MKNREWAKDILMGVATGDALGVPVEFLSRSVIAADPVKNMRGYGTHGQPAGTWSDDSSLTFCLAEMLCNGYNVEELANRFINWREYNYWTAHGRVFDIGIATNDAISRLRQGCDPLLAGGRDEGSNGNGSLMRILPLVLYAKGLPVPERFRLVDEVSSLTHGHVRSVLACFVYTEFAGCLLAGVDKQEAWRQCWNVVDDFLDTSGLCPIPEKEWLESYRECIYWPESRISASGYVVKTLQAAFWCLFHTDNYQDAVLKAVNLGDDTDTVGAVTGGLAGLLYGWDTIPGDWLEVLAKREEITELAGRLDGMYGWDREVIHPEGFSGTGSI